MLAAAIANAVADRLSTVAGTLSAQRSDGSDAVRATVLTPATAPLSPSSPNVLLNIALALAGGLVFGVAVALLRHLADTKIRTDVDVRTITESPILGSIAFDEHVPEHPVIIADEPHSSAAEAVRRLRTNLQFIGNDSECKTLVITSSVPGEGKSTTSINLAASMADAGARVILIDADLRRPSIAKFSGVEGRAGLTSILIGRAELEDVTQPWRDTSLTILPSGPVPPNPSELLGSVAMTELLDKLTQSYDVVLLDTPPLLPVTDAAILTKMVGGALVVVGADRLHRGQLQESLANLETAGAHVHGMVLNKVAKRDANSYGYGYSYGYASYAPETTPVADPSGERTRAGSGKGFGRRTGAHASLARVRPGRGVQHPVRLHRATFAVHPQLSGSSQRLGGRDPGLVGGHAGPRRSLDRLTDGPVDRSRRWGRLQLRGQEVARADAPDG